MPNNPPPHPVAIPCVHSSCDIIQSHVVSPKRPNAAAWGRYEKYKLARTVGEARHLGAAAGDVRHDVTSGFAVVQLAGWCPTNTGQEADVEAVDKASLHAASHHHSGHGLEVEADSASFPHAASQPHAQEPSSDQCRRWALPDKLLYGTGCHGNNAGVSQ